MQQVENPMPAVIIILDAAHIENHIVLDYVIFEVALQEPGIRHSD
jgi:hypothetical protein